jgi:hypothetical protein
MYSIDSSKLTYHLTNNYTSHQGQQMNSFQKDSSNPHVERFSNDHGFDSAMMMNSQNQGADQNRRQSYSISKSNTIVN